MTSSASNEDPLLELVRKAACGPLGLLVDTASRLPSIVRDGEKQFAMARNLGRVALRAAQSPRASAKPRPATAPTTEPVAGVVSNYGDLTAAEVIVIVRSAGPETLAWVRSAEEQGKARVTVLRALDKRDADHG